MQNIFIVGGAGFIGSHVARYYLQKNIAVTVFDNFSSGKEKHFDTFLSHPLLTIVNSDIKNTSTLNHAIKHHDLVFHFAANPDISKAETQPDIDFWEGTYLLQLVLEAMRQNQMKHLIYASGSGVYGDVSDIAVTENYAPLQPISTYGASKLACESLISAYCHLFDMHAAAFRFANVVGAHQTHGVAFDFIKRLKQSPDVLHVLGNGTQSKSYIHVNDIITAMHIVIEKALHQFSCWNVATEDYITVKEIAALVLNRMELTHTNIIFQNKDRGWKGDVPIVRINSQKIRDLGWKNTFNSYEALQHSIDAMIKVSEYDII